MNDGDLTDYQFAFEPELEYAEFVDVLIRSSLAERRPVDDESRIRGMLRNADVIVTARSASGLLVGVARSITDFSYCTYLSDLAVDVDHQRRGIGKTLIDFSHEKAGVQTTLVLLSAPAAESYYPRIGLRSHHSCWTKRGSPTAS